MPNTIQTEKIGKLGFGYMRLPKKGGNFDWEQINRMADTFIESGGTYFDAAYVYDGAEAALRETVIKRHRREDIQIATKLPLPPGNSPELLEDRFKTSLKRLGTDYVDFYLIHGIDAKGNKKAEDLGAWDYLDELKSKGLVRHAGFSFHGPADDLEVILHRHPEAEFVQLQINYHDWEEPDVQARRLHEIALKYDVPIIVMEPLLGGLLASGTSPIASLLLGANPDASLASWALRYVAQLQGVFVTLSGMSTYGQVVDNIKTYSDLKPLSESEQATLVEAVGIINSIPRIGCTDCKYCVKDCPAKINIPDMIDAYNIYLTHNTTTNLPQHYMWLTMNSGKAGDCAACRVCEDICPQNVAIVDTLAKLSEMLD